VAGSTETTTLLFNVIAKDQATKTLLKAGATLTIVGAAALAFAKQSVSAYNEAEAAQTKLSAAYAKFPKLADVSIQSLKDLADETAKKTIFDHNATMAAEAQLAVFNLTGKQIEQVIPLVQDYAAFTGKDLVTAAELVGKSLLGNALALKDIGIKYKATGDTAKDFAVIQADLSAKVGGFAEKQGKTAAGQAAILQHEYKDLQETVGAALVPALKDLIEVVKPIVGAFNELDPTTKQVAVYFAAAGVAALVVVPKIAAMKNALISLGLAEKVSGSGVSGLALALGRLAIAIGLAEAAGHAGHATGLDKFFSVKPASIQDLNTNIGDLTTTFYDATPAVQSFGDKIDGYFNTQAASVLAHFGLQMDSSFTAATQSLSDYDQHLAGLVQGGNIAEAAAEFDRANKALQAQGYTGPQVAAQFKTYLATMDQMRLANDKTRFSTNVLRVGWATLPKPIYTDVAAIASLTGELATFNDKVLASQQAQVDLGKAIRALPGLLKAVRQGLHDSKGSLDAMTVSGGNAKQTVIDFAHGVDTVSASMVAQHKPFQDIIGFIDAQRASLIKTLESQGVAKKAATDYVNALLKIPAHIATELTTGISVSITGKPIAEGLLARVEAAANVAKLSTKMATGGIVTKPTIALIGEAGPEAVVPLRGHNSPGSRVRFGGTVNYSPTYNITNADPQAVVRAIEKYEKANTARWRN
jgi:hypothetical protein